MFEMEEIKKEFEITGFHSIYSFEFGKDFSHIPEKHDFWEMVYVDAGRINAITNGVGCSLEQGQAIFHEPMEIHAHVSDKQVANNMLVISFTATGDMMEYFKNKTFTLDKTCKTLLSLFFQEAQNSLGKIPSDYEDKGGLKFMSGVFGGAQLLECYFTEFLIKLVRNGEEYSEQVISSKETRGIANNSLCELICEFLNDEIYGNISLNDLCRRFMFGKTQLCKIFRDNMGQSPMEYYMDLKINEAKKMLREKKYTVSQIADMLGYSCIHNFSRAFKKRVGFSPTEYTKTILL